MSGERPVPARTRPAALARLLAAGLCLAACGGAPAEPPSLVLVVVDTLRADRVGCYGFPGPTTPHLDRLAAEGVRFEQALSAAPWTLPSMTSLMTSTHPSVHGAGIWRSGPRQIDRGPEFGTLGDRWTTLAEVLHASGYRTRALVCNPFVSEGSGLHRGFDEYTYRPYPKPPARADAMVDAALEFLDGAPRSPFFLYLHLNDPHHPHFARPEHYAPLKELLGSLRPDLDYAGWDDFVDLDLLAEPERRVRSEQKKAHYEGAVAFADHHLGRLLERLRRDDSGGRTLVVVVSDHGEELWEHARLERERYGDPRGMPGFGHGHSQYQELLRVPLVLAGPGVPEGRVVRPRVSTVDVLPTILDLLDVEPPAGLQGRTLRPLWEASEEGVERELESRAVFSESIAYGRERKAVLAGRFKYIFGVEERFEELYDLERDPGETTNLAAERPELAEELRARLEEHLRACRERAAGSPEKAPFDDERLRELQALGYGE